MDARAASRRRPLTLPLAQCQTRLAQVWGVGSSAVILFVALQIILGKYGENGEQAVKWVMTTVLPSLGVIVGAVAYSAHAGAGRGSVTALAFRMAWWGSFGYLALALMVLLMQPLSGQTPVELMNRSLLFLTPVQGLIGTALGVFFSAPTRDPDASRGNAPAGEAGRGGG